MSSAPETRGRPPESKSGGNWLLALVALAAIVIYAVVWLSRPSDAFYQPGDEHPAVGDSLVALQVQPLLDATEPVELSDLRGQVTLVQFWGPWCPPCLMELPHVVELQEELADAPDFRLLSVSCGPQEPANLEQLKRESQQIMQRFGADWPVYTDPHQISRRALVESATMPQGFAFPTTVLLDREGTIAALWTGYYPGMEADVQRCVQATLNNVASS